ncbi:MAG: 6-phosphogluconolactonase [Candidatus Acidiferrales bacterium]
MKLDTRVFPDIDALSRGALEEVLRNLHDAVAQRGRFAIALSGGHTPAKMYALWGAPGKYRDETPWDRVHLFWGDERYVPADDPLSNYRMTREALLAHVPIPAANVHPTPTSLPTPEKAAEAYDAQLRGFFGAGEPAFDVTLLGLGPEGHCASLFPGSPALEEKQRWVVAVQVAAKPPNRLTFTLPVLNRSRNVYFLVAGEDKRKILAALRAEPDSRPSQYPAGRIRPADGRLLWLLDQAAAD